MTFTLGELTYMVARELGIVDEGVATGGGTTSLIDTNARTEDDDFYNGGTVWILRDAAGLGAAPENEYGVVSDFANSTSTATMQAALTAAIASGDRYAIADDKVPLHIIIQKINQALGELRTVPYVDVTSITTADNQTEYTLPIASKQDLRQVFIQGETDDANDNQWREIYNWKVEQADPGVAPVLIVPGQFISGYSLKLVYMAVHADLHTYTDPLSEFVPKERVIYPAVAECFRYRKQRTRWNDWDSDIAIWQDKTERAKRDYPIRTPRKAGSFLTFASNNLRTYPGDRNPR